MERKDIEGSLPEERGKKSLEKRQWELNVAKRKNFDSLVILKRCPFHWLRHHHRLTRDKGEGLLGKGGVPRSNTEKRSTL